MLYTWILKQAEGRVTTCFFFFFLFFFKFRERSLEIKPDFPPSKVFFVYSTSARLNFPSLRSLDYSSSKNSEQFFLFHELFSFPRSSRGHFGTLKCKCIICNWYCVKMAHGIFTIITQVLLKYTVVGQARICNYNKQFFW